MRDDTLILGAVAYDAKVVPIWDGFRAWFNARGLAFDYVLYTNYERQVDAHLRGDLDVAWNSPLAWIETVRLAAKRGRRAEAIAMRDTDCDLTSVVLSRADGPIHSLADSAQVQVAYAIGVPEPVSVMVRTEGAKLSDRQIEEIVRKQFDFRPRAIIEYLNLRRPIFRKTAAFGHFGRNDPDFTWEATNRVKDLRNAAGI